MLAACQQPDNKMLEQVSPQSGEPLVILLDTLDGYRFQPVSGDSVQVLSDPTGRPIITGRTFVVAGSRPEEGLHHTPSVKPLIAPPVVPITGNGKPLPIQPELLPFDRIKIRHVRLGQGLGDSVMQTIYESIPTGKPFTVAGSQKLVHEPPAIAALPMRFRDGASASILSLDVDQGMPSSYVFSVLQDRRGNLWFGTDGEGACRYNGTHFASFNTKNGFPGNAVFSMAEDNNGTLWFATDGGICAYDGINFTNYNEQTGLPSNHVNHVFRDSKNNLWFASAGRGAWRYNGKTFTIYSTHEGLPSDSVYRVTEDNDGNIWLATRKGAAHFDGQKFAWYLPTIGKDTLSVTSVVEDNNHHYWLGTSDRGLFGFFDSVIQYISTRQGLASNEIYQLAKDRNGRLLISCSYGGLAILDGTTLEQYGIEEGLSNAKVRQIIEDKDGNLWCGTDGGGVNKLNTKGFHYYINNSYFQNSRIRPVAIDNSGMLWLGGEAGGIRRFDGKVLQTFEMENGISDFGVRALFADKQGALWVGGSKGIDRIKENTVTNFSTRQGLAGDQVMDIRQGTGHALWIATYSGGVSKLDSSGFTNYGIDQGLPTLKTFTAVEDSKQQVWIGTDGGGLCRLKGNRMQILSEKEGLPSNAITNVFEDHAKQIWIGTVGGGICRLQGDTIYAYTKKNGLSDNNVWSITEDDQHRIWVGTDRGLNLLQPVEFNRYRILRFGWQDGLRSIDFNLHSAVIDKNNHCWWGTGKGLVSLDLSQHFAFETPGSLRLLQVEVNEQAPDYRWLDARLQKHIQAGSVLPFTNIPVRPIFTYDLNHLTFHFGATDWSYGGKILYSYRMIGLDNRWSMPSTESKADYRNLKHGRYVFEVKAMGASQQWTKPVQFAFTIQPAWWQTWWFKTMLVLMAILLLLYASRMVYLSRLRKQKLLMEKELAVQWERQRIAAEMHDDIGAGLSGVRLLTEITKSKSNDPKTRQEMERIYQSIGDISSKMKEVIWSLNTENDHLSNLLLYIQKQVRNMLEHYPATLNITIPDEISEQPVDGKARRNIYLAVKEAVHNIIKHSQATKVDVQITYDGNLVIRIADNGKGMLSAASPAFGNGLKNMQQRMQQVNGQLRMVHDNGLTLIFEIPISANT